MKKWMIIVSVILTINGYAQNTKADNFIKYYNATNEAYFWFYDMQYDSAVYYFELSRKFVNKPKDFDRYNYARALWENNIKNKAIKELQSIESECVIDYFKNDTTYFFGMTNAEKTNIQSHVKSNSIQKNIEYERHRIFIDSINYLDQIIRRVYTDSIVPYYKYKLNDTIFAYYSQKLNEQDSLNGVLFINYLKLNPSIDLTEFSISSFMVHQRRFWYIDNYVLLNQLLLNGKLNPFDYASGIDRMFATKTYNCYFSEVGNYDPFLIFINRMNIGLSPYYVNTWHFMQNGKRPQKTNMYSIYEANKKIYNCTIY